MKSEFTQFLYEFGLFFRSITFYNFDIETNQIKYTRIFSWEIWFCRFFLFFYADLSHYQNIADIRMNKYGRQNLFYSGFKHCRKDSGITNTRWVCTYKKSKKCKGLISTVEIDGVAMMKVVNGEHTHEPHV